MSIFRRASDTIFKNKNPNGQLTVDRDYIMLDIGDPTITRSAQIGTIIRFSKLPKLNGIRSKKKRSDVLDYKTRQCMYIFDRKDDNTQNDDNEDFGKVVVLYSVLFVSFGFQQKKKQQQQQQNALDCVS